MASARGFQSFSHLRIKPNGGFTGICDPTQSPRLAHADSGASSSGHSATSAELPRPSDALPALSSTDLLCILSNLEGVGLATGVCYAINALVQSPAHTLSGRLGLRAETLKGCLRQPASCDATHDIFQFGVYTGRSMRAMSYELASRRIPWRRMWGFDSFEGLPRENATLDEAEGMLDYLIREKDA